METVESIERDGCAARIVVDSDPMSPREWDNLWTLHIVSRDSRAPRLVEGTADTDDDGRAVCDGLIFALHQFEDWHPVVTIDDEEPDPDGCYAYVTRDQLLAEYGHKIVTAADKRHAREVLQAELTALNQYYANEVYGYVVEDESGETLDSCWGFYGLDYAREEAARVLDYWVQDRDRTARESAVAIVATYFDTEEGAPL